MLRRLLLFIVALGALNIALQASVDKQLQEGFINPPASAKARTWWHWLNGNITKEGIRADLEAMQRIGIQEAQIFNVDVGYPEGPVTFMSPHWLDLFKFAALEAKRLGMELGFNNSAGWSSSGGPWVEPEYAMQKVVYSEIVCSGGRRIVKQLPRPVTNATYYKDIVVLAFPKPQSGERIADLDFKNLSERIRNRLEPDVKQVSASAIVYRRDIIDLTNQMSSNGTIDWQVPAGEWVILRLGHTLTGAENHPAVIGGKGLECDKMSKKAVDVYWKGGVQPIIEKLGSLIGTTVVNCLIDSYEVGCGNWTIGFDKEFKKYRGYDCLFFMPTFAGYYVDGSEITERFLWDYRKTISDLMSENYYGYFRQLCNKCGMKLSVEPYWGPFDCMQVGNQGDIVMSEFWSGELAAFDSPKFVSSIAHLNGQSIVGAESFTGFGKWLDYPAAIKSVGDKAWTEGINRFIFHTYTHQPWNIPPGVTFGVYGFELTRLNTWWNQGKAFMDYIGRSQFLLQQGHNVADILVFAGEYSPNNAFLMPEIKAMGYDYDLVGVDKIQSLNVKNGNIFTPFGVEYRMLLLPKTDWMTPEILMKLKELSEKGALILGYRPCKSPSLQNYPECDEKVRLLANQLWNDGLIKECSLDSLLVEGTIIPDFKIEGFNKGDVNFVHRRVNHADIYFIASSRNEQHQEICHFRVSDKVPELWNPMTGEIKEVAMWDIDSDGSIKFPISFDAEGSTFVIFRKPITNTSHVTSADIKLSTPEPQLLPDLKIIKAEYGTFLPAGLADATEGVVRSVRGDTLDIYAGTHLSPFDPAPGYVKELRIEYEIAGKIHTIYATEGEHLVICSEGQGNLIIRRAIYGKFNSEITGVPMCYPIYDVKEKIESLIKSGKAYMKIEDKLVDDDISKSPRNELLIVYSTMGQVYKKYVPKGSFLNLAKKQATPQFILENGKLHLISPYKGEVTYVTSLGKSKTVDISDVPKEIKLEDEWNVNFKSYTGESVDTIFNKLISWPYSSDERIRYFSGTAVYKKSFVLSKKQISEEHCLELDLGSVHVMAEISLNGKYLGVLWKAPFVIGIDKFVKEGFNVLEIKVTNLWVNRLIGDEYYPADYSCENGSIKQWPSWLMDDEKRCSKRSTFSTWKHWSKDSSLQPSGLLGPVVIRTYVKKQL